MSDFEGQPQKIERIPLEGTYPIEVISDLETYRKMDAPTRKSDVTEFEHKTSRLDHIVKTHGDDILEALKVESIEQAFKKMAQISLNENNRVAQLIGPNGNIINYDFDSHLLMVISKDLEVKETPPPVGKLVTAYPSGIGQVKKKIAEGTWVPISEMERRVH